MWQSFPAQTRDEDHKAPHLFVTYVAVQSTKEQAKFFKAFSLQFNNKYF